MSPHNGRQPLSVRQTLAGKHLFVTGTTGFVGKVLLAMIAAQLPEVRRVSVLVRTNSTYPDARERFDAVVALSDPFQAIAEKMGHEEMQRWLDEKVNVVAGDITFDRLGLSDDDWTELTERDPIDLLINVAGKVNFNPPLDQALAVNALGVDDKFELAKAAGAAVVHMSTCFVAGERSGPIPEDAEVIGYTPSGKPFDPLREREDAVALAEEIRRRADAQVMETRFADEAREALTREGLDYEDPERLREALDTYKQRWVDAELVREGTARAKQWGWTNTYTYTKSMGEQLTLKKGAELGVPVCIVRPAIVESSLSFPFPGWNEGVNTSAPIVYVIWKGHRYVPCNPDNILDIVPVDYVARGTLLAAAALLQGRAKRVYQFSTGDVNPMSMERTVELTNLAWRKAYDDEFSKDAFKRYMNKSLEAVTVSPERFDRWGAPAINRFAKTAAKLLGGISAPGPVRPVVRQLEKTAKGLEKASKTTAGIMELFQPFIEENNPVFSSRNVRDVTKVLVDEERAAFGYTLDDMDWRHYWMDVHLPGLRKWVFGELDDKLKKVKKVARARDLVEVFRTATRAFAERKALSHFTHEKGLEATYTYEEFWEAARRVAAWLRAQGVRAGDRVVLMSKNEPAWPMIYVGILLADAASVPVDPEMPVDDVKRIAAKAEARLVIVHESSEADFGLPTFFVGDVFEAEPLADDAIELRDRSEEVASLLFTSGTTGDPKGVMLTHGNFTALLASLHGTFNIGARDRFLSVLPLFHTFEFSCGMLMPLSVGASICYLEEIDGPLLRSALKATRPTALIGVPALWDLLYRRIETQVDDRGESQRLAFNAMMRLSRHLRRQYGLNAGPFLFSEVHSTLGGNIRHLISGGAALGDNVLRAFEGLGFELLEGYGLTEAAPVLTVRRPGDRKGGGSVGKPIPSVQIQVVDPDEDGVGEVVARGDNVMMGYLNDPQATAETVRKGWLHTGDLGKLDRDGRLILVGRRKEIIVTSSGKNVYPDELEPLYEDHPQIKELAIVGVPDPQGDERVAALVVVVDDAEDDAQEQVRAHFQKVAASLPDHKRVRTLKFWHGELPRTATRKVKRKEVRAELVRLLEIDQAASGEGREIPAGREPAWVYATIAGLSGVDPVAVEPQSDLVTDLGLSSLQLVELRSLLEERGGKRLDGDALSRARTVAEVAALAGSGGTALVPVVAVENPSDDKVEVPSLVRTAGRRVLHRAQVSTYDRLFDVRVDGEEHIPLNQQCIVIANHCSHLDAGLVKYALGDYAPNLSPLAASDYFFDNKAKRTYFEQFTNLIPVERGGSLETSLRQAEQAIRQGRIVLVFPEGTRSRSGELQKFRHGIGYLVAQSGLPVLPLWLRGTYKALPKGAAFPTSRRLSARIGPVIGPEVWRKDVERMSHAQQYAFIAERLQAGIEALREGAPYPWLAKPAEAKKRANGLESVFDELNGKFKPENVKAPITWYFSLGEAADGKWTVSVKNDACVIKPGRPEGKADCVLKTDPRTFEKIVRERYVPGFAEFAEGKIKTNDPNLLFTFQNVFGL